MAVKGFTVVLDKDYKDEDAEIIANAIGMIKGVMVVETEVATPNDYMNRVRMKIELQDRIYNVFKNFENE